MLNTVKSALECNRLADGSANNAAQQLAAGPKAATRGIAIAVVVATGLLGGCASYNKDHVIVGSVPQDYRTAHPIIVSENDVVEDIAISASTKTLSLRERNVVHAVALRFKRSGSKTLRFVLPSGSRNEHAARRVSSQMVKVATDAGVPRGRIKVMSYHAAEHGDAATVRLIYTALAAEVGSECGVWDDDLGRTKENRNYTNFGCATQSNLATMVANPADLVGPRGESEIDAGRRDTVIENWRTNGTGSLPDLL